jgi:hypothetical protein
VLSSVKAAESGFKLEGGGRGDRQGWSGRVWAFEVAWDGAVSYLPVGSLVFRAGRGWRHWPLLCMARRTLSDGGQVPQRTSVFRRLGRAISGMASFALNSFELA